MKKFLMLFALTLSPAALAITPPAPDSFNNRRFSELASEPLCRKLRLTRLSPMII